MKSFVEYCGIVESVFKCPSYDEGVSRRRASFLYDVVSVTDGRSDFNTDIYIPDAGIGKVSDIGVVFGTVRGSFFCNDNGLTSLEGSPIKVCGRFDCDGNSLASLEHSPEYVGGTFNCSYNELSSLKGAPKYVGGNFICVYNRGRRFSERDVLKACAVKGKVMV